jgi:starvation-inducible DNA-binding protein
MIAQNIRVSTRPQLGTPTDLTADAVRDISGALNALLADVFALYINQEFSLARLRTTFP